MRTAAILVRMGPETASVRLLASVVGAAAAGCCPIPVDTDVRLVPAASFEVKDAQGRPVEGARVLVQTESQPHARSEDPSIELVTDVDGCATLVEVSEEVTAYPLMMHGVPAYSWHACVDHPALGATTELTPRLQWENPSPIVVVLRGEPGRCVAKDSRIGIERPASADPKASASGSQGQSPGPANDESGKLPSERGPVTPPTPP